LRDSEENRAGARQVAMRLPWHRSAINVYVNHNWYDMTLLPPFTEDGLLPPGDHRLTVSDLKASFLVHGPEAHEFDEWDSEWRLTLVERAEVLVQQLWEIGIREIFLDGSFVEAKPHPNDIDGYFVCDVHDFASGMIERKLNALDPHKVWTWDPAARRAYRDYVKKQLPMWHLYRVELYPHFGQLSGIKDRHGHDLMFPAAFRLQRNSDIPKGIVQVVRDGRTP